MKINKTLALLLIIGITLLYSCTASQSYSSEADTNTDRYVGFNDWSGETELEIKQAYWLTSHIDLSDFKIAEVPMYYFGVYSGYAAVLPNGVANDVVIEKTVGGHEFKYGNANVILMYKDGAFTDLEDTFKNGMITQEDVDRINEKYMSTKAKS